MSSQQLSPFISIGRTKWSNLEEDIEIPLSDSDIEKLRGLGDPLDLNEVHDVYLPLRKLINLSFSGHQNLQKDRESFLKEKAHNGPFVIGIGGSVAVGKSTVARLLRQLLSLERTHSHVQLVTTDGFLYPNAELQKRELMDKKGFPESYNQKALFEFLYDIKSGKNQVKAPYYSHTTYDIVPEKEIVVNQPSILILEGLNVLAPPVSSRFSYSDNEKKTVKGTQASEKIQDFSFSHYSSMAVSDFFDFSIYIDAKTSDIKSWYINRFLQLRATAFQSPDAYFHRYADLTEAEGKQVASHIWSTINEPNLEENILPTRQRAGLVLNKNRNHRVQEILLRKM